MNKRTIAIITIVAAGLLVVLFIILRVNKDLNSPADGDKTDETSVEESTELLSESPSASFPTMNHASENIPVTPTLYGKPVETEKETEPNTAPTNKIATETVDVFINGIDMNQVVLLKDILAAGYQLDKKYSKELLNYNSINNPYLTNVNDKNDQIMAVIINSDTTPNYYSECKVQNVMINCSNSSARISIGTHDVDTLDSDKIFSYFGAPNTYLTDENSEYISYSAQNIQFNFEFQNQKMVSVGITYPR